MDVICAILEAASSLGEEAFKTKYSMSSRQLLNSKDMLEAIRREFQKLKLGNKVEQFDIAFHNAKII